MTGRRIVRAYIGLGANLGDPAATLSWAIRGLRDIPGLRVRDVSPLYATMPWGVTDQPEFRNAVVAIDSERHGREPEAAALDLLGRLKALERAAGRRPGRRWGPRELDLDLLLFGRHRVAVERPPAGVPLSAGIDPAAAGRLLEVPHPSLRDRLFVLAPLADLAPRLVPPGWHETIRTARARRSHVEGEAAAAAVGTWDAPAKRWRDRAG